MKVEEKYMRRCIQLAKNGLGRTYPNPLVGSVIVWNDRIIGEGWHQKAGSPHAEVNAIQSVKEKDLDKLEEATLYVNLEPCSHYGKTPPCADLIAAKKIPYVVIGNVDPNPQVGGKGVAKLMNSCKEVVVGCLEEACENLNKRFLSFQRANRPYVILKWAESQDGFLAPPEQPAGKPVWITNPYSKQLVHKWRSEEQSIMVGTQTALKDNPALTTRLWKGPNPVRILIDRQLKSLKSPYPLHLLDERVKTIVFCERPEESSEHLIFEGIDFEGDTCSQILNRLYEHDLQSVIIEGGARTLQLFIEADLWDEARVFTGKPYFGNGIKAPQLSFKPEKEMEIDGDILKYYFND